jgi:hypothetical protein
MNKQNAVTSAPFSDPEIGSLFALFFKEKKRNIT